MSSLPVGKDENPPNNFCSETLRNLRSLDNFRTAFPLLTLVVFFGENVADLVGIFKKDLRRMRQQKPPNPNEAASSQGNLA